MLGVVALACLTGSHQFPAEPIQLEFDRGVALARREKKHALGELFSVSDPKSPLSSVFQDAKKPIGWWSNGYEQMPTEFVVWLSPTLMSRWLGFLSAQEYWSKDETASRWAKVVLSLEGRRAFVVQLSAYPKIPTYGIGDEAKAGVDELEHVRFVYTAGSKAIEMSSAVMESWQSRNRFDMDGYAWWTEVPVHGALTGEFDEGKLPPLPVGGYFRTWTLVWVEGEADPAFEVRVLSKRKERVARFSEATVTSK